MFAKIVDDMSLRWGTLLASDLPQNEMVCLDLGILVVEHSRTVPGLASALSKTLG